LIGGDSKELSRLIDHDAAKNMGGMVGVVSKAGSNINDRARDSDL